MITSWLKLKQCAPIVIFHQLGSGTHGNRPRGTRLSGDGTGSGEGPSANGVQRTARSLCTDHYGHISSSFFGIFKTFSQTFCKLFFEKTFYIVIHFFIFSFLRFLHFLHFFHFFHFLHFFLLFQKLLFPFLLFLTFRTLLHFYYTFLHLFFYFFLKKI